MLHKSGKIALKLVVDTSRFRTEFLIYSRCDRHISESSTEVRWLQIFEILKRVIFQTFFFFAGASGSLVFTGLYKNIGPKAEFYIIISFFLAKFQTATIG